MDSHSTAAPTLRPARFRKPAVALDRASDGTLYLRSEARLPAPARSVGDWLIGWAHKAPDRVFLAERQGADGAWRSVTYGAALDAVERLATFLLDRDVSPERPVVILSENSIDHALITLAAMHIGVPVATVSTAYSLSSNDHRTLGEIIALLRPGVVYVSDAGVYAAALTSIAPLHDAAVLASGGHAAGRPVLDFQAVQPPSDRAAVMRAHAGVGPETIARFLLTSGSTGKPKAVINTHGMLCSNQEARRLAWPFLAERPPVILDWLPWSHTFGANHNFNMILRNGGTLYIDAGKPIPGRFATTIANLREVRPNLYFNVPRGYDLLAEALEKDAALGRRFFRDVELLHYAGAALSSTLAQRLERLSIRARGHAAPLLSSWGATETAPLATDCNFAIDHPGNIGLPVAGAEVKLVPTGGKLEVRVRGPNVTPGYWRRPDLTAAAFDEEGYYRTGDAARLADPDRPEKGLLFDGRISEDFKLASGTWVSVGDIRVRGVAALHPVAGDIVVTGHDGAYVGFLVFPNEAACRRLSGLGEAAPLRDVLAHPTVQASVAAGLRKLREATGGSSQHARRARLLERPPALEAGEINDKGYLNQRKILALRAAELELLHGDDPAAFVALDTEPIA